MSWSPGSNAYKVTWALETEPENFRSFDFGLEYFQLFHQPLVFWGSVRTFILSPLTVKQTIAKNRSKPFPESASSDLWPCQPGLWRLLGFALQACMEVSPSLASWLGSLGRPLLISLSASPAVHHSLHWG